MQCLECCARLVLSTHPSKPHAEAMLAAIARFRDAPGRAAILECVRLMQWPVNGQMVQLEAEEWKDILTAAFHQETARLAMGLNGGVVMLGQRTSQFGKKRFSEWMEFLHAIAAQRGVVVYQNEVQQ